MESAADALIVCPLISSDMVMSYGQDASLFQRFIYSGVLRSEGTVEFI